MIGAFKHFFITLRIIAIGKTNAGGDSEIRIDIIKTALLDTLSQLLKIGVRLVALVQQGELFRPILRFFQVIARNLAKCER